MAQAGPSRPFQASIDALTAAERDKMSGRSWREGCPVALDDLASIHLNHVGFDGDVHDGVLVVHRRLAKEVVEIFGELFDAGFPIERLQPYEDFPVGEYAASNDSVGFYCRPAQDNPSVFSWHAYGLAVDLNSMTNPFLDPKEGWWPQGSNGERNRAAPGLVTAESEAVKIFMRHGWAWGGIDKNPDYMHFAKVTVGEESNPLDRAVWADHLRYAPD
ncbi:MAG: M15 family metallopeptidase [Bradyrhizobium sp.]